MEERKEKYLHTNWAGRKIYHYDTVDSTNCAAKRLAEEGAVHGTLVLAEQQTAGRGRLGRVWETPKGTNIAMSLLMRPDIKLESASMLTLLMGMAVTKAINEMFGLQCGIKWPNDVVWEGKKLCGILTEMQVRENKIAYIVLGCGINVNTMEFSEELEKKAVSLKKIIGKDADRIQIIQRSMEYMEYYYHIFKRTSDMSELMDEYNEMLVQKEGVVCVLDSLGSYNGIALGINKAGELLVRRENGKIEQVYSGEVSVRGVYGYV